MQISGKSGELIISFSDCLFPAPQLNVGIRPTATVQFLVPNLEIIERRHSTLISTLNRMNLNNDYKFIRGIYLNLTNMTISQFTKVPFIYLVKHFN